VFRVLRSSEPLDGQRVRYRLRAVPIRASGAATDDGQAREVSSELDADLLLDKLRFGQVVPTPEATFEALWQQLRIELDLGYD